MQSNDDLIKKVDIEQIAKKGTESQTPPAQPVA
jgi:hypothetical protein